MKPDWLSATAVTTKTLEPQHSAARHLPAFCACFSAVKASPTSNKGKVPLALRNYNPDWSAAADAVGEAKALCG